MPHPSEPTSPVIQNDGRPIKLHLGCGNKIKEGYYNFDNFSSTGSKPAPGVQFLDLNGFPWPFASNSADEICMIHVLEHLPDTYKVMDEIKRILKPGGRFVGVVPYAYSNASMDHPQHVRHFTTHSFFHFESDFGFKVESVKLSNPPPAGLDQWIRFFIPFKGILCRLLNNIYDNVEFSLVKG